MSLKKKGFIYAKTALTGFENTQYTIFKDLAVVTRPVLPHLVSQLRGFEAPV